MSPRRNVVAMAGASFGVSRPLHLFEISYRIQMRFTSKVRILAGEDSYWCRGGGRGRGRCSTKHGPAIGRIKYWYCGKRGYGFIQPEEGGEVIFVHHTCIAPHAKGKSLKEGARVTYEVTREKMAGLWARNVCIAD